MKLFSLLIDEPSQIIKITLNLLKLILTFVIPYQLFNVSQVWNVDLNNILDSKISAIEIVIGLFVVCLTWFIIWEILEIIFFMIVRKFGKSKKFNKELKLKDLQDIFKFFRLYSETKGGYVKPSTKATEIAEAINELGENFSIKNTFFLNFVLVSVVSWIYLLVSVDLTRIVIVGFVVSAIIILFLLFILFFSEKLLTELQKNRLEIKNLFETLVYKSIINHVTVNFFDGALNREESNLTIKVNDIIYNIFDYFAYLRDIGEIKLKGELEIEKLAENSIIVVNFTVSNEYRDELEKKNIFLISADTEERIIVEMVKFIHEHKISF